MGRALFLCLFFRFFFFFFILANFSFPGTVNFVGEFLVISSCLFTSGVTILISAFGLLLGLIYSLVLYSKIFFGPVSKYFIRYYCDITRIEFFIFLLLTSTFIFFGLIPNLIFDFSILSLEKLNLVFN